MSAALGRTQEGAKGSVSDGPSRPSDTVAADDVVDLAAVVLDEEARRHEEQAARVRSAVVLPDDLLPAIGGKEMPLAEVLSKGGKRTIGVLFGLGLVDNLDQAAFNVLAPDIQNSLNISDGVIGVIGALAGFTLFLAAIPLGVFGDRTRRTVIAAVSTFVWAAAAVITGAVQGIWQLVAARTVSGIGKANEQPIQSSILADAYPPEGRGRIFGLHRAASPTGMLVGPLLAGGVAAVAGGAAGWRWAFVVLAVPAVLLGIAVLAVPEPKRGHFEQLAVLGEEMGARDELPVSLSAAFARLKKIRTFHYVMAALGALGFAVTTVPIYMNLILEENLGLGAGGRGLVGTLGAFGAVLGAFYGGRTSDQRFRESPERAMVLLGASVALLGIGLAFQAYSPNAGFYVVISFVTQAVLFAGLVPLSPIVASVVPYRLRSMGYALVGLYLSLVGGLMGAVLVAVLAESVGRQMAIAIVAPTASILAGGLLAYAARFVRSDIASAANDLLEEREEIERMAAGGELPILQVRNVDFSYGPVQVLFGVDIDVRRGEVLALLGTNGAGKSTLLRVISGLALPDRGVVRLHGRTITYLDAELRVGLGVVQVPGGNAIFPDLTVAENFVAGAYRFVWDRERVEDRVDRVIELLPVLGERMDQLAGTLSGGEQQMLAIGKALLLDPDVLLLDELTLGLAPVVVQTILATIEQFKAEGMTIVIVEQSVNVALSIADRAVFMERGQIRFEGPAAELLERDDLVRAVFLGGEGG